MRPFSEPPISEGDRIEAPRAMAPGQLAQIDAGRQTVAEFAREWWRVHAEPNLATRTRESYAAVFDKHILPGVGGLALRDVTPAEDAIRAAREAEGVRK